MFGVSQRVMMGTSGGAPGGGDPPEITVNAVHFDGTNDWVRRGTGLTGAVDNDTSLISFWFNMTDGDSLNQVFAYGLTSSHFRLKRQSSNRFQLLLQTSAGSTAWSIVTNDTFLAAGGWVHILASHSGSADVALVYINDLLVDSFFSEVHTTDDVDWTQTDWIIGSRTTVGADLLNADLAEFYITNEFLDLAVEGNRRKFISDGGKPVDLEGDGSGPTGTAPLVYLTGPTGDWHLNQGSGGTFTVTGALTTASSSPSD